MIKIELKGVIRRHRMAIARDHLRLSVMREFTDQRYYRAVHNFFISSLTCKLRGHSLEMLFVIAVEREFGQLRFTIWRDYGRL
jgi:hypothetical protein